MLKCDTCDREGFANWQQLINHEAAHSIRRVRKNPLSYLLVLPNGVTPGRYEAAGAFVDSYVELKEKHPDIPFHFFPFSYETEHRGKPALNAILAIAATSPPSSTPDFQSDLVRC